MAGAFTPIADSDDSVRWRRSKAELLQARVNLPRFGRHIFIRKIVYFKSNTLKLRCGLHHKNKITVHIQEK